ncbi:MAG TPA: competence/damage-inducible protein A [Kofleriaceae bacterium]|nr:competence/damage-inducible protein A [Kofleriaceae bacterium]
MHAEILTIGDELTRGEIVDTNSAWLAAQLWDLDVTVRWMTSCCDDEHDLRAALLTAAARADLVVCSGGLGPTEDDLTVDVVARATGADVVIDEPARARLEAFMASRGRTVSPVNLRQARVPRGARVHANPAGLAPGFEVLIGGTPVICLPGVPRELHAIFEGSLRGHIAQLRLARGVSPRIARRTYRVFGRAESQASEALRGLVDRVPGASIHYQVKFPEVLVKLVVRDPDIAAAEERLLQLEAQVVDRLGDWIYGIGDDPLPLVTGRALLVEAQTVAVAESCTGGLLGALLTELPGSSGYFAGGAVAYANREKVRQLGVREETLAAHGAVSEETATEMARGALELFATDIAIAITGIAGPDGGTPAKPVGTVWLARALKDGTVTTFQLRWPGARDQVRLLAAWWGLKMIYDVVRPRGEAVS